jgi:hypothetical protein
MYTKKILFFIVGVLLVVNCSASGTITPTKTNSTKITNTDGIQVFINKDAITGSDESNMALNLFETSLMDKLKSAGKSKFYTATEKCSPACKYKVEIVVTRVDEVSSSKRALAGAFAGRAKIFANGKLTDLKSALFSEFSLEELSSGGTVLAGTTVDVAKAAGTRIADHIILELGH